MSKWIVSIAFLLSLSCQNQSIQKQMILDKNWSYNDPFVVEVDHSKIKIVIEKCTFHLTYSEDYPFENIYLRNTIATQTDTLVHDVISYSLQDDLGKWIGKEKGDHYTIELTLPNTYVYPDIENFTIKIEQYTREEHLQGIQKLKLFLE